jgi:hypothetical protein
MHACKMSELSRSDSLGWLMSLPFACSSVSRSCACRREGQTPRVLDRVLFEDADALRAEKKHASPCFEKLVNSKCAIQKQLSSVREEFDGL